MDILSKLQQAILRRVGAVPDSQQFSLTGGTALAQFYLKHRKSQDLDFFTSAEEVIVPFSHRLEGALKTQGFSTERQRGLQSFVELVVRDGQEETLVHLAQDAAFRFEAPRRFPDYPDVNVDSLADLAANKLLALFGRATLRDFLDVYWLVTRAGFTTEGLMERAKQKDPGFDRYWLGVALERIHTFPEEAPEMLLLMEPLRMQELRALFDRWREAIVKELKR